MTWREIFEAASQFAAIATAVGAVLAYVIYLYNFRQKRIRLEKYLRGAITKIGGETKISQRSVLQAMAKLGMSERDVMEAAFRSRHIRIGTTANMMGNPSTMTLEFSEKEIERD